MIYLMYALGIVFVFLWVLALALVTKPDNSYLHLLEREDDD